MKQISVILSKNANYAYHMLSVAKVGYDNDYGNKYMNIHSKEDLNVLKQFTHFISVQGGEHCGELYWLISQPAALEDDISLEEYYSSIIHLFTTHNIMENKEKYYDLYYSIYNVDIDRNLGIDTLIDFHKEIVTEL